MNTYKLPTYNSRIITLLKIFGGGGYQPDEIGRHLMIEIREHDGLVTFAVRVQPRASCTEITGEWEGALRVRLAAPPLDDRANDALRRLLAARLKVPVGAVRIVAGERSRTKRIEVRGVTAMRLRPLLIMPAAKTPQMPPKTKPGPET